MSSARPAKVDGVSIRELEDGETVVLPPEGKAVLVLNATGAAVLDLCDGRRTVDDIVAFLGATFPDVPRARIEADVTALVDKLVDGGCLRR